MKESTCPCGAILTGPIGRIITSKIDYFDGISDTNILLARSKLENENEELINEFNSHLLLNKDNENEKRKKDKKKQKISRLDNRGNFSEFRNKNFVPNTIRNLSRMKKQTDNSNTNNNINNSSSNSGSEDEDEDDDDSEDDT